MLQYYKQTDYCSIGAKSKMAKAPWDTNTAFTPEQAVNYIVSMAQILKLIGQEPHLQIYCAQSQACEHCFAQAREHCNHDNSCDALANSLANQVAAYFLEDEDTVHFDNAHSSASVFGKVYSSSLLDDSEVKDLYRLS